MRFGTIALAALFCFSASAEESSRIFEDRLSSYHLQLLEKEPGSRRAVDFLWSRAVELGRSSELVAYFGQRSGESPTGAVNAAAFLLRNGEDAKAVEILRTAAAGSPDSAITLAALAEVLEQQGEVKGALQEWKRAIEAASDSESSSLWWERLVALSVSQGSGEQLDEVLRLGLEKGLPVEEIRLGAIRLAKVSGDTKDAEKQFQILLEPLRGNARYEMLRRGTEFFSPRTAIGYLREALGLLEREDARRAVLLQEVLGLYQSCEALEELRNEWIPAAEGSRDSALLFACANLLDLLGEPAARLEMLRKAAAAAPSDPPILEALAISEDLHGSLDGAEEAWRALWRHVPESSEVPLQLAGLEVRRGEPAAAAGLLESVNPSGGGDASGWIRKKIHFYRMHSMHEDLVSSLQQFLQQDPGNSEIALELAEEHLLWKQNTEASLVLHQVRSNTTQPDKAGFSNKAADLLLRMGSRKEALEWAKIAVEDNPKNERQILRLMDLLILQQQHAEAQKLLEKWIANFPPGMAPEPVEKRLFDLLAEPRPVASRKKEASSSLELSLVIPEKEGRTESIRNFVVRLQEQWEAEKEPGAALRLSRFRRWEGDVGGAAAVLRQGLTLYPESVLLREAMIQVAREQRDLNTAIRFARELAVLDSANRNRHLRDVGFYLLDLEDAASALEVFSALADENPDSVDCWRDLAVACQRTDEWFASLTHWRKVLQLSQNSPRYIEMLKGALPVALRTGYTEEGLDWILRALGLERNDESRVALLQIGKEFAEQTGSGVLFEERIREMAGQVSNTNFWKNVDLPVDSQQSGAQVQPSRVAAESRESSLSQLDSADLWIQKANAGGAPAQELWNHVLQRFPRNPDVFRSAAQFYESTGQTTLALECLQRLKSLVPPEPALLLRLGKLNLDRNDRATALDLFASVLETVPDPDFPEPYYPELFPIENKQERKAALDLLRIRAGSSASPKARSALPSAVSAPVGIVNLSMERIEAIAAISSLVRDSPMEELWLKRWNSLPNRTEKIHGLFHLGQHEAMLAVLEEVVQEDLTDYQAVKTFFEACLEFKDLESAFRFLRETGEELPERVDFLLSAISRRAVAGKLDFLDALETELAAEGDFNASLRWPIAQILAASDQFFEAVRIGIPSMEAAPLEYAGQIRLDLLDWALISGQMDLAKEVLKPDPGRIENFDDPAASLWRARWLLESADGKELLLESAESSAGMNGGLSEYALLFLFQALSEVSTAETAKKLVELRGAGGFDQGVPFDLQSFLRTAGERISSWGLTEPAINLLEAGVGGDSALQLLRGHADEWAHEEIELLWAALNLEGVDAGQTASVLGGFERLRQGREFFIGLGGKLEQFGNQTAAQASYFKALELGENEALARSGIWRCAQGREDHDLLLALCLERIGSENISPVDPTAACQMAFGIQLTNLDWKGARSTVLRGLELEPGNKSLLQRLAALDVLDGKWKEAISIHLEMWRNEADVRSAETLIQLALQTGNQKLFLDTLQEMKDKAPDAFGSVSRVILEKSPGSESAIQAANWLIPVLGEAGPETRLFTALCVAGKWDSAVELLRTVDEQHLVECIQSLRTIRLDNEKAVGLAWNRLQNSNLPGIQKWPAMLQLGKMPERLEEVQNALSGAWQSGEGDYYAGESLLQLLMEREGVVDGERDRVFSALLLRPEFQREALKNLAGQLKEKGHPELAAQAYLLLVEKEPHRKEWRLEAARLLHKNDALAALSVIKPLIESRFFFPERFVELGRIHLDLGYPAKAEEFFLEGVQHGPHSSRKENLLGLSQAYLLLGDPASAEDALRKAARISGPSSLVPVLADYFQQLGESDPIAIRTFALSTKERLELFSFQIARMAAQEDWVGVLRWIEAEPSVLARPDISEILRNAGQQEGLMENARRLFRKAETDLPSAALREQAARLEAFGRDSGKIAKPAGQP